MLPAALALPPLLLALLLLCFGTTSAQFETPGKCYDEYECVYEAKDAQNRTFNFDLRPLCKRDDDPDYVATDTSGHTYAFKICGNTVYQVGPRYW